MKSFPLLFCVAIIITALSCKKEADVLSIDDKLIGQCRIAAFTFHGNLATQTRHFSYNAQGQLISVIIEPAVYANDYATTFTYQGSTIIAVHTDNSGYAFSSDTIMFDQQGKPVSLHYSPDTDGQHIYNYFHNSSTSLLDSVVLAYTFAVSGIHFTDPWYFQWRDGDMVHDDHPLQQDALNYSYYPGTYALPPALDLFNEYMFLGRPYGHSAHLLKDAYFLYRGDSQNVIHHSYAFDKGGKVIADTSAARPALQYLTYMYECP